MAPRKVALSASRLSRGGLILAICAGPFCLSQPLAQTEADSSIKGCIISGGTNTNVTQTCNFNMRFGLTPSSINNIVSAAPKNKPVVLTVIGGNRAQRMGDELQQALVESGLKVQRNIIGVMAPPPDDPLTIDTRGPQTLIVLFPAA